MTKDCVWVLYGSASFAPSFHKMVEFIPALINWQYAACKSVLIDLAKAERRWTEKKMFSKMDAHAPSHARDSVLNIGFILPKPTADDPQIPQPDLRFYKPGSPLNFGPSWTKWQKSSTLWLASYRFLVFVLLFLVLELPTQFFYGTTAFHTEFYLRLCVYTKFRTEP